MRGPLQQNGVVLTRGLHTDHRIVPHHHIEQRALHPPPPPTPPHPHRLALPGPTTTERLGSWIRSTTRSPSHQPGLGMDTQCPTHCGGCGTGCHYPPPVRETTPAVSAGWRREGEGGTVRTVLVLVLVVWCYPCLLSGVSGVDGFDCGLDERDRERDNDCIAIPPQESHAAGNPISQRECAGFNAARFPVAAVEDVTFVPSANLTTSFSGRAFVPHRSSGAPFQSPTDGVGHGVSWAIALSP